MLLVRTWLTEKVVLVYALTLLMGLSIDARALFEFGQASYTHQLIGWDTGDVTINIPFRLRSCQGRLEWLFGCSWRPNPKGYYLKASDFGLQRLDNDGLIGRDVTIGRLRFTQGANRQELQNNTESPDFAPGAYQQVDANMEFTFYQSILDQALPGTYRSNLNLDGGEPGAIDDTTRFIFDIKIPKRVKISGLEDLTFTGNANGDAASGWKAFCVFSQGAGAFRLTAYGRNSASDFRMKQGAYELPYHLWMRSKAGSGIEIIPQVPYQNWNGSPSQRCQDNAGSNMELEVRLLANENDQAAAGIYQDTLTIMVEAV